MNRLIPVPGDPEDKGERVDANDASSPTRKGQMRLRQILTVCLLLAGLPASAGEPARGAAPGKLEVQYGEKGLASLKYAGIEFLAPSEVSCTLAFRGPEGKGRIPGGASRSVSEKDIKREPVAATTGPGLRA